MVGLHSIDESFDIVQNEQGTAKNKLFHNLAFYLVGVDHRLRIDTQESG